MLWRILAILGLLSANAFFVAAEFAIVRARRPRLEALAREGDRLAALALRASDATSRVLAASELGITLSSLALGWILAGWLWSITRPRGTMAAVIVLAAVAVATTYLHIVFAELAPRAAALARPERVARLLAPALLAFTWITRPVTALLASSFHVVNRRIRRGVSANEAAAVHGPDELRVLVEQSQELGALERQDADLLEGVFEFSEKTARDVMTPRTEIVALPLGATLDETLALVEESGLSRYPVYDGTIDNIVGLLLAKDLLPVAHDPPERFDLRALVRPVHVIPGTREVEEVLADFKRRKEHLAVVLDEYGGTLGLVTMEDLLEEIVGEILDEYDVSEAVPPTPRAGELVVPGEMNIGELNERYGLAVPETDYTTIGGYVFGAIGRLPQPGDTVQVGGGTFTVTAMEGRRVAEVAVRMERVESK
ncbi:MAG TPA: hemolysin family protein [Gemmatimonadaceae bacterium]